MCVSVCFIRIYLKYILKGFNHCPAGTERVHLAFATSIDLGEPAPPCSILLTNQLQVFILLALKTIRNGSKNGMRIIPFKKSSR